MDTHLSLSRWLENSEVDSPEFQRWFAGSVLQLPSGRPMRLFHGTKSRPFKQFEVRPSKRFVLFSEFEATSHGFFFSENPADARTYGPNVVACYVKLQKPFLDPRTIRRLGYDRIPHEKEMQLMRVMAPMIQRETVKYRDGTSGVEPFIEIGVKKIHLRNPRYEFPHQWVYEGIGTGGLEWDVLDNPQSVARMKALGYDGTFVHEKDDQVGRSVFVMQPDQSVMIGWGRDWQVDDEEQTWD